jgi:hypothetical protein
MSEPISIVDIKESGVVYSICTFVTRFDQYKDLIRSFVDHGFSYDDCEYIYIDNSERNQYDAYRGINKFLTAATGTYIIICHQDVLLIDDGRQKLDVVLGELDGVDPRWGVCGNGGGVYPGRLALRITDPHGDNQFIEPLPRRVTGLDENFLVVRRDANLAVSADLKGFHLYGTDICIVAQLLGYTAYVVDFHLRHLSSGDGKYQSDYPELRAALIAKYRRVMRPRTAATTTTAVYLGGSAAVSSVLNAVLTTSIPKRLGRLPKMLGLRRD